MPAAHRSETRIGTNRTGVQMSPLDAKAMLEGLDSELGRPSPDGDESGIVQLRSRYIAEADPIGTVPRPGGVRGAAQAGAKTPASSHGAKMPASSRPQVLLDKLGERLAFERGGTRLYEALIGKCEAAGDGGVVQLDRLRHFHDEEAKHFKLLSDCIESLGADPTAQTPCADVAGVETSGLMQVVTDPQTSVSQSLHALLVAELADKAAWDELIALSTQLGHGEWSQRFEQARLAEREHLETVASWHSQLTMKQAKTGSA